MSAEGISMRDTKAVVEYIKSFGFYEDFMTYTQLKRAELNEEAREEEEEESEEAGVSKSIGRPEIPEQDVDNDSTSASKENGTNTKDGRESG